jgi:rod shape-determining protein MreD
LKYVILALLAWLLSVFSVSAMPHVQILGVTPNLVLILACCWAALRSEEEAFVGIPIIAVVRDLVSSDPVGTSLLAMAPLILLGMAARQRPIESAFLPTVAMVTVGTLIYEVIYAAVIATTGQPVDAWYVIVRVAVPAMVVNALFSPIVYLPVRWLSPVRPSVLRGSGRLTSPL